MRMSAEANGNMPTVVSLGRIRKQESLSLLQNVTGPV